MKGLLLKDLYVLSKQMKFAFLFIAVIALMPQLSMTNFAIIYVSAFPLTALAYDERSKWDKLALTMPYTHSQLVISKYLLGIIFTAITALLVFLGKYFHAGLAFNTKDFKEILLIFCLSILIMSLLLPALLKFGVEKGRILFILVAVIFSALFVYLTSENTQMLNRVFAITDYCFYLIPVFTVGILLFSILISVGIYKKKDF